MHRSERPRLAVLRLPRSGDTVDACRPLQSSYHDEPSAAPQLPPGNATRHVTLVSAAGVLLAAVLGIGRGISAQHADEWVQHAVAAELKLGATGAKLDATTEQLNRYRNTSENAKTAQAEAESKQPELDGKIAAADARQTQPDAAEKAVITSQRTNGVHVVGTDTAQAHHRQ